MNEIEIQKNNRQIATWLLIGVGMLIIQVLLGGITRLTESGLSITEWKPITGALPPLNEATWQQEFEKYRHTDQFKYVHQYFSLKEFKFIFFWEWFHRFWARMMGVVFAIGFIYFLAKKKMNKAMITPMVVLFFLGGIQGAIGWIMVASGLVPKKYFVGHVELTTHFIAAMILVSYTLWFALSLLPSFATKVYNNKLKSILQLILGLFFIQLVYGGFMAGLKAASTAPTWPSINGNFYPVGTAAFNFIDNLINNPLMIHFIHRGIAYVILIVSIYFFVQSKSATGSKVFDKLRIGFLILILLQVMLGVSALLASTSPAAFVYVGVAHQFTAMMLVICLVSMLYIIHKTPKGVKA
jgi:cytochrome c oxidase assembly protein subunit 15